MALCLSCLLGPAVLLVALQPGLQHLQQPLPQARLLLLLLLLLQLAAGCFVCLPLASLLPPAASFLLGHLGKLLLPYWKPWALLPPVPQVFLSPALCPALCLYQALC